MERVYDTRVHTPYGLIRMKGTLIGQIRLTISFIERRLKSKKVKNKVKM